MSLQDVQEEVSGYMDKILKLFKPGKKITVLVRAPGEPEQDFSMTSDTGPELQAMIARRFPEVASLPKPEARPEGEGLPEAWSHPMSCSYPEGCDCGASTFNKMRARLSAALRSPCAGAWRPMETAAVRDVLAERRRQVEKEGWTPEHDDEHARGVLAVAGACYALAGGGKLTESPSWQAQYQLDAQRLWPFDEEWYKPRDPRRDLLRAAALILAEIERLDRAQPPTTGEAG